MIALLVNDRPVDVPVVVERDRALLPLRACAQALGASISYDARSHRVIVRRSSDRVTIAPHIIKGRTYVPLRFLAESFGVRVSYDARAHAVRVVDPTAVALNEAPPAATFTTPAPVPSPLPQYGAAPPLGTSIGFNFYTQNARAFYPNDWMDFVLVAPPGGTAALQMCIGLRYPLTNFRRSDWYEANVPAPIGYFIPNCLVRAMYTAWTGQTIEVPVPLYIGLYTARAHRAVASPSPVRHVPAPSPAPRKPEPTPQPTPRPVRTQQPQEPPVHEAPAPKPAPRRTPSS